MTQTDLRVERDVDGVGRIVLDRPEAKNALTIGMRDGIIDAIREFRVDPLVRVVLITGEGDSLVGRLLLYDALHMDFQEVKIRWDADCPVCGKEPTITELIDYEQFCGVPARPE